MYAKLKGEIRSTFSSEGEIKLQKVNDLPYLNACIDEGLRIFPPAPIGFLRAIQPEGDVIDGHSIPRGVSTSSRLRRKSTLRRVIINPELIADLVTDGGFSEFMVCTP